MAVFRYQAKSAAGEQVRGTVSAPDQRSAIVELSRRGFFPIEVVHHAPSGLSLLLRLTGKRQIKPQLLADFYRNLGDLLGGGVTIPGALSALGEQYGNSLLGNMIKEIIEAVNDGASFSEALARHSQSIPQIDSRIIIAGETGGKLEEALARLADQKETEHDIRSRIRSAFAYPVLLIIASIIVVIAFVLFVAPNLVDLVENSGQELPLVTRIVITSTELMMSIGWIPAVLVLASVIFRYPRKCYKYLRRTLSRLSLKLPVIRDVIIRSEMMNFARTLESLLRNGVPILSSWDLSCGALRNAELEESLKSIRQDIEQGRRLGPMLKANDYVPSYVATSVAVGEESNRLERALSKIADTYGKEMDRSVRLLTTTIEPIMILIVGTVVGILVISLLLPIFQLDVGGV